jgi:hypothetical protein
MRNDSFSWRKRWRDVSVRRLALRPALRVSVVQNSKKGDNTQTEETMTSQNNDDDDGEQVHYYSDDDDDEEEANDQSYYESDNNGNSSHPIIIGLFGAHGATGTHFVKLALDAGYAIQALAPSVDSVPLQNEHLTVIPGSIEDNNVHEAIPKVIRGATFVVCLLADTLQPTRKDDDYPEHKLLQFLQILYPYMTKSSSVTLFLHQANSLTNNADGTPIPILARMMKKTIHFLYPCFSCCCCIHPSYIHDQDSAIQFIVQQQNNYSDSKFHYIITRPGMLREGPSQKRLTASKSLPGPFPITHADLAEFTLGALMEHKWYDTAPYVVGDGTCSGEAYTISKGRAHLLEYVENESEFLYHLTLCWIVFL